MRIINDWEQPVPKAKIDSYDHTLNFVTRGEFTMKLMKLKLYAHSPTHIPCKILNLILHAAFFLLKSSFLPQIVWPLGQTNFISAFCYNYLYDKIRYNPSRIHKA